MLPKMAYLTRDQQSSLIELYHKHRVLWDSSLPAYRDQCARSKALAVMQTAFHARWGMRLEINDIKTKLQSFRAVISREMTKVAKWRKNNAGEDYTPSYSHWHELQFLTKVIKKRDSLEQCSDPTSQSLAAGPVKEDSCVWIITSCPQGDSGSPASPPAPPSSPPQPPPPSPPPPPPPLQGFPTPALTPRAPPQQQRPPATSSTASDSKKRQADLAEEAAALGSMQQYLTSKSARVENTAVAATEDPYSIWARSLIEDLKKVRSENKRAVLQIQINRLVQDEILKQIKQECGETF